MHTERTTLNLPVDLIKQAQNLLGAKTKTEAIVMALEDVVRRQKQMDLIKKLGGSRCISLTQAQLKKMRKPRFTAKDFE